MREFVKSAEGIGVSLGKSGQACSEPAMLPWRMCGVAVMGSWRFPGGWEGKCKGVRGEELDEVAYAWGWKGDSIACESCTFGEDV